VSTLDEKEADAIRATREPLGRHYRATRAASQLIGRMLDLGTEGSWIDAPLALRVGLNLLVRIHNDLRCAVLVGLRGYPLQAASHAASAFEAAYSLAYVGADDGRAREWIEHPDPRTQYAGRVKALVTDVLARAVPADELEHAVDLEYGNYRQLCGPKHVNPVIQQGFGTRLAGDGVEVCTGPELHEDATRVTWFALESGVRVAAIAVRAFAASHLSGNRFEEVERQVFELSEERRALAHEAIARGWAHQPDPPADGARG
jgi:hypothetical protein